MGDRSLATLALLLFVLSKHRQNDFVLPIAVSVALAHIPKIALKYSKTRKRFISGRSFPSLLRDPPKQRFLVQKQRENDIFTNPSLLRESQNNDFATKMRKMRKVFISGR